MAGQLARALNAPGGITIEKACARAALQLEVLGEKSAVALRDCIADLAECAARGAPSPQTRRELHALSCTIAGLGGMFGREALSKAAYCFCRLLDETEPGWNAPAVAVHIDAMRLLHAPDRTPHGNQAAIVDGLNKVRLLAAGEKA